MEKIAEDFCACKDAEDKGKCHDEWVDKYADFDGSGEDGQKLAELMMECDMTGLLEVAPKLEKASK
ncbi:MAG: hypothetical protein H6599_11295 [Flavobacteriales bacterium]|nr:hypothetical protein [Flavobacteriales bacterium]